ncbi:MAG: carbohydrate ABC transporter permease [Spirochaetaceae bacterium]|nr:carbohydrate ABC transporter permease [Spirochaetaceae bacterium]
MKKNRILSFLIYIPLLALTVCMLFPFLWMILSSLKTPEEIILIPPTLYPKEPTFENYRILWNRFDFAYFFMNSIFITLICVSFQVYSSALFGFVLGKYRFRGRDTIFMLVLLCMMVPYVVNVIPQYQMMLWFHWLDTYRSVIVTNLISLFGIFMMRQFSNTIPNETLESARIDGAGELRIFHAICLPMFKNPLSALIIMQFLWTWDAYLWPLLMLVDVKKYTITLGLGALNGQFSTPVEKMLAGSCMAIIPVLTIYLIFQKRFVEGMAGASIKG